MGHHFERIAEQGYVRRRGAEDLPLLLEWGGWEGADRAGESLEMDMVARLGSGRMLTGSVKWNRKPVGIQVHHDHMRDPDRLARSGYRWAHEAQAGEAILLYVAARGFEDGFRERADEERPRVVCWSLDELCGGR
ncbi:MAG TPA: hypothetical protein VE173_05180 [Longimicrobiales bacterium]|nr:hypothetical protein [Longimicrobiales bacterium]